jgi:hypothetical protein
LIDHPARVRLSTLIAGRSGNSQDKAIWWSGTPIRRCSQDCRVYLPSNLRIDLARKVVGVGSVGTRAWIMLLNGIDDQDPLLL